MISKLYKFVAKMCNFSAMRGLFQIYYLHHLYIKEEILLKKALAKLLEPFILADKKI
jgi:hypothetical protein